MVFIQGIRAVMENVLLVVSLLCCIALIVAVLIQRSEGGALGMGGGGGGGGLMSGRGAADTLVHVTMVLAAIFFVSCLALTRIAADNSRDSSDVIRTLEQGVPTTPSDLIESTSTPETVIDAPPADLFDDSNIGSDVAPADNVELPTSEADPANPDQP